MPQDTYNKGAALQRASELSNAGKKREAIRLYDSIISDKGSNANDLAAAYMSKATIEQERCAMESGAILDQGALKASLDASRWLLAHDVKGTEAAQALTFQTALMQRLTLTDKVDDAISFGKQVAAKYDVRDADRVTRQQLFSIVAQAYEKRKDKESALEYYNRALAQLPNGGESALIQQEIWRLSGPQTDGASEANWERLIKEQQNSRYIKTLYANYANFLEVHKNLERLKTLSADFHSKFTSLADLESFEGCSVDWHLSLVYKAVGNGAEARRINDELSKRCSKNFIGDLAKDYVASHKGPSIPVALPLIGGFTTVAVLFVAKRSFRRANNREKHGCYCSTSKSPQGGCDSICP